MRKYRFLFFPLVIFFAFPAFSQVVNDHTTLLGKLSPRPISGQTTLYSDIWGYSANNHEYAIMGCYEGTSIIDVTDPQHLTEVAFISGPHSIWRDIKTYSHYAYVVHDANDTGDSDPGLQIIDLSNLPNSNLTVTNYNTNFGPGLAHNLYIDDHFAYLTGARNIQGCIILDLTNPTVPVQVGSWTSAYWHDIIVKNDTLYGSAIYGEGIQIVDGTDKSNLKLISQTSYPGVFTHNIWMTEDNQYIAQTDEIHNEPLNFWDVSNHSEPERLATYTAGENSIAHNAHVKGNYVYMSYYYDGLKVIDISNRNAPVEVGNYDSYPDDNLQRGTGYEGAWGCYPFLPSGKILISDITYGLHVISFDNTKAGFIKGIITNSVTNQPVSDVKIRLNNKNESDGETTVNVGVDGKYSFGSKPGNQSFTFSKFGYNNFTTDNIIVKSDSQQTVNIKLVQKPIQTVTVSVKNKETSEAIPNAKLSIFTDGFSDSFYNPQSASIQLPSTVYDYYLNKWGFQFQHGKIEVPENSGLALNFSLQPLYDETFTDHQEWTVTSSNNNNGQSWIIGPALETNDYRYRNFDKTNDVFQGVLYSRSRNANSAENARTSAISPLMDATKFTDPTISYYKFFNPYQKINFAVNDTLNVYLSNNSGQSWMKIKSYTEIDGNWVNDTFSVSLYMQPTNQMKLKFENVEGFDNTGTRYSSFAMIDEVRLGSKSVINSVNETDLIPETVELKPNFPNPFNPGTTIRWTQPSNYPADISVYNSIGQKVKSIHHAIAVRGSNQLELNFSEFSSGIYFYQIHSANQISKTGKLILVK